MILNLHKLKIKIMKILESLIWWTKIIYETKENILLTKMTWNIYSIKEGLKIKYAQNDGREP